MRTCPQRHRAALPVVALLLVLVAGAAVQAETEPTSVLRVESDATGEIGLEARGVTIEQALAAIASRAGFEVVIEHGIQRPPVNMAVSTAPVEAVLRQILRGRNYALVYDAEDASLSRVIVLAPSAVRRRSVVSRRPTRVGGAQARARR